MRGRACGRGRTARGAVALALLGLAIATAAAPARAAEPPAPGDALPRVIGLVAASWDSTRGGFVSKDGVPDESAVELAYRLARAGEAGWEARARHTVDWTWGLFDTLGSGFVSRGADVRVGQRNFEKRTDANARRLENRVDAWRASRAGTDERAIRRTLDFFERVLEDGRGGFVAGQIGDRNLVPAANGLAVHAYLAWAAASGATRPRDFALRSLDRVWTVAWEPQLGLLDRDPFGNVVAMPRLEDQVEMGRALVLAAHLAGRENDLAHARAVADLLLARFEDPKSGGMRAVAAPGKDGTVKKAPRESAGNARAALFLAELASVAGEPAYREAARRLAAAFVPSLTRPGPGCADWALALRAIERADLPERPRWQEPVAPSPRSTKVATPARPKGARKK